MPPGSWLLHLGAALYACNLLVGAAAQWRSLKLGVFHHRLYAFVAVAAVVAAVGARHPALVVTLTALALLPFMPGGAGRHLIVATTGALGYVGAYLY